MLFRTATPLDVRHILPMLGRFYALHRAWDPGRFATREGFEAGYGRWLAARANDPEAVFIVAQPDSPTSALTHAGTGDPPPGGIVATDDTRPTAPIAFLIGTIEDELPLYTVGRYGFIHDLWVDDAYRNEGVARQLVTLALERFKALGLTQVRCDTAIANAPAQALFERAGFRPSTLTHLIAL